MFTKTRVLNFLCILFDDIKRYIGTFCILFVIALIWNAFSYGGKLSDLSYVGELMLNTIQGKPAKKPPYISAHQKRIMNYIQEDDTIKSLNKRLKENVINISKKETDITKLSQEIDKSKNEKEELNRKIVFINEKKFEEQLVKFEQDFQEKQTTYKKHLEEIEGKIQKTKEKISSKDKEICDIDDKIKPLKEELDKKGKAIKDQEEQLKKKIDELNEYREELKKWEDPSWWDTLKDVFSFFSGKEELEKKIKAIESEKDKVEKYIDRLTSEKVNFDKQAEKLEAQKQNIKNAIEGLRYELKCTENRREAEVKKNESDEKCYNKKIADINNKKEEENGRNSENTNTLIKIYRIDNYIAQKEAQKRSLKEDINYIENEQKNYREYLHNKEENIRKLSSKKLITFIHNFSDNCTNCAEDAAYFSLVFLCIRWFFSILFFFIIPFIFLRRKQPKLHLGQDIQCTSPFLEVQFATASNTIRATAPAGAPFIVQKEYIQRVSLTDTQNDFSITNAPFSLGAWCSIFYRNLAHMVEYKASSNKTSISLDFHDTSSPFVQFFIIKLRPGTPILINPDSIVGYAVKERIPKLITKRYFNFASFLTSRHIYHFISGDGILVLRSKGKISSMQNKNDNKSGTAMRMIPFNTLSVATAGLKFSLCKHATFANFHMHRSSIYWCQVQGDGDIMQMQSERKNYLASILTGAWDILMWILGIPL